MSEVSCGICGHTVDRCSWSMKNLREDRDRLQRELEEARTLVPDPIATIMDLRAKNAALRERADRNRKLWDEALIARDTWREQAERAEAQVICLERANMNQVGIITALTQERDAAKGVADFWKDRYDRLIEERDYPSS